MYALLRNRVRRAGETELEAASTGIKLRAGDPEVRDHLLVERIPVVRAHVPQPERAWRNGELVTVQLVSGPGSGRASLRAGGT